MNPAAAVSRKYSGPDDSLWSAPHFQLLRLSNLLVEQPGVGASQDEAFFSSQSVSETPSFAFWF